MVAAFLCLPFLQFLPSTALNMASLRVSWPQVCNSSCQKTSSRLSLPSEIGVGAELIYYPYWWKKAMPASWAPRKILRVGGGRRAGCVLKWDMVSMVIYTGATVAFYLLGAAVLYGKGLEVTNNDLIPTLSNLYQESLDPWALAVPGRAWSCYTRLFLSRLLPPDYPLICGCSSLLRFGVSKRPKCWASCLHPDSPALFIFYVSVGQPLTLVFIEKWLRPSCCLSLLCGTLFSLCQTHRAFSRKIWVLCCGFQACS